MKVKLFAALLCVSFSVAMSAQVKEAPMPELVIHQDGQYALYVDAKPFFILGGQSGNSNNWPAMELDAKAFAAVMEFIRDYSKSVDKLFRSDVPAALLKPEILAELGAGAKEGSWTEVFGERADEYFHAWHVASYIEYVAAAGKAVYPLPMYVNAALRSPFGNPPATQYESGGPTDNVICIYKAAAPSIDLVAPDIYQRGDKDYMESIRLYTRPDNCLMVPETISASTSASGSTTPTSWLRIQAAESVLVPFPTGCLMLSLLS